MRKIFFWLHLIAGCFTGAVILILCVTGVLLTYEQQMLAWADRGYRTPPAQGAGRLPVESLVGRAQNARKEMPTAITLRADPTAPAELLFGRQILYVNAYTGEVLGEPSQRIRAFFRSVTELHRYLAMSGESRATGRAITGACNLLFLFLVVSGFYLWLPRKWSWQHVKPVVLFRGGLRGKARDFNWHNVIGLWSAVPLFLIVISGAVISYPWATRLVYQLTGTEAPAPSRPPAPRGSPAAEVSLEDLDALWSKAEEQVSDWKSINLRLPSSNDAPLTFTVEQVVGRGRPDKRVVVTLNRSGEMVRTELFAEFNLGRKVRSWLRWIHTGEAGGIPGQTLAGIVSAGGAVLVWTGIALALRRFRSWRTRKESRQQVYVETR